MGNDASQNKAGLTAEMIAREVDADDVLAALDPSYKAPVEIGSPQLPFTVDSVAAAPAAAPPV